MKITSGKLSATDRAKWEKALAKAKAYGDGLTDEEDAAIMAAALADPDNPTIPDDAKFVTYQEAKRRGRPRVPNPKRLISLRLDEEVVTGLRALGDGWQTKANSILKEWLEKAG